ncbi:MAG: c-type cytochrome [bacterium]|nr:c-type cytochrome [bacterium]MCY3632101.1 c-type cytochrome [bacterium]
MHLLAASTQRNLGMAIAVVAIVGFAIYLIYNVLWAGRGEKGSEVELAPNRKPYLSDEELETKKLDLALVSGLVTLVIIGVALPLYWLGEPGRQQGYLEYSREQFTSRGAGLFEESCSSCHGGGGLGGTTATSVSDDSGNFVAAIEWDVPALTTVLYRFSEEEVRHILNYGRPPTPMQAWGGPGGGPLTTQQVDELIQYIQSIQLDPDEVQGEVLDGLVLQVRSYVLNGNPDMKARVESAQQRLRQATEAQASASTTQGMQEADAQFLSAQNELDALEQEIRGLYLSAFESPNPQLRNRLDQAYEAYVAVRHVANDDEEGQEAKAMAAQDLEDIDREIREQYIRDLRSPDRGELLFNNGVYGCARCHTPRDSWQFTGPETTPGGGPVILAEGTPEEAAAIAALGNLIPADIPGGGAFGPNLTNGATLRQFDTAEGHAGFVTIGSQEGVGYGNFGQGDGGGQMPAFGECVGDRDSSERSAIFGFCTLEDDNSRPGMLTADQIADIVAYERGL